MQALTADSCFLGYEAPLPVGTNVVVAGRGGYVVAVVEQDGGKKTVPGMKVRFTPSSQSEGDSTLTSAVTPAAKKTRKKRPTLA